MTAINKVQCDKFAQACREIQHTLERSPTLIYVPGRGFQHRSTGTPPSPPLPPSPPPWTLDFAMIGAPPPSPPPPKPPPYYATGEECLPVPTLVEASL